MPARPPSRGARAPRRAAGARRELVGRLLRYAAGSGIATVCSEVTFLVLYGAVGTSPAVASTFGWLAGALPNYWLNRSWTWRRTGRPSLRREVLPYVAIILATVALATLATTGVDALVTRAELGETLRVVVVGATFLGVYGVVFVLRYLLLDRLFRRAERDHPAPSSTSSKESV